MKTKEEKLQLIQAAMGQIPCDKTVTNIQFVNVFTGEIYPAKVDIFNGYVIRVRTAQDTPGKPAEMKQDGRRGHHDAPENRQQRKETHHEFSEGTEVHQNPRMDPLYG